MKTVKVKQSTRKGKTVKAHYRKVKGTGTTSIHPKTVDKAVKLYEKYDRFSYNAENEALSHDDRNFHSDMADKAYAEFRTIMKKYRGKTRKEFLRAVDAKLNPGVQSSLVTKR